MRPWRNRRVLALLLAVLWLVIFYVIFVSKPNPDHNPREHVELVWWTDMPNGYEVNRRCGKYQCLVTNKQSRLKEAEGVLFYAPNLNIFQMPLPRSKYKIWALLHDESPRNVPYVPYDDFLQHFNYTSTFSQYSDLPLTTQYLPRTDQLVNMDYVITFTQKQSTRWDIVFLQTDCDTMSGREDYVRELMKHIPIDSFGGCLHNRDLPLSLQQDYLNKLYSSRLLSFLNRYKFMIAFENGVCDDYITEKFWRPLIMGVIPIYFGAPNIRDWEPNNHSVIYVEDFQSPGKLAAHLEMLINNGTAYNAYLTHKYDKQNGITNQKLKNELFTRKHSIAHQNLFRQFECMVCQRISSKKKNTKQMADDKHYSCPLPPAHAPLGHNKKPKNAEQWQSIMAVGRCKAQLLNKYWQRRQDYTQAKFNAELEQMVAAGFCD